MARKSAPYLIYSVWQPSTYVHTYVLIHVFILSPLPLLQIRQMTTRQVRQVLSNSALALSLSMLSSAQQDILGYLSWTMPCFCLLVAMLAIALVVGNRRPMTIKPAGRVKAKMGASFTLKGKVQLVQAYIITCKPVLFLHETVWGLMRHFKWLVLFVSLHVLSLPFPDGI